MPLDPQCQVIVDATNAAGVPFETQDYPEIRKGYESSTDFFSHPTPTLDSVANLMFAGPETNLPVRLYRPRREGNEALPTLVFYHGGGWVVGNPDTHDHVCRYLAARSQCLIASVDYRLAPEHPFPAAFDDAVAGVRWVQRKADEIGADADRIAVGGDSAGGNLAAAAALAVRGEIDLRGQLLIYPAVDFTADNDSLRDNGSGYSLTNAAMDRFMNWYLPSPDLATDWRASPQHAADHSGLPPTLIQSAEFDPLRDEADDYGKTLRAAGVDVDYHCHAGMIHGFARMGSKVDGAFLALDEAVEFLKRVFA